MVTGGSRDDDPSLKEMSTEELTRIQRHLRASLALARDRSPAAVPIERQLRLIRTEVEARQDTPPGRDSPRPSLPARGHR